jgi:hypothetical protein
MSCYNAMQRPELINLAADSSGASLFRQSVTFEHYWHVGPQVHCRISDSSMMP